MSGITSSGPVVLITGCSSGIGLALAQEFARRGCRVVATARRREALRQLVPPPADCIELDVTDAAQVHAAMSRIKERFGRLDLLINNAGYGLMAPLMDLSADDLDAQLQTNTVAPLVLAQLAAPLMRAQGRGVIANIGSVSGEVATPFAGAYCASKAAVNALSDVLRMELAPFGIHVVSVLSGAVRSGFGDAAVRQRPRRAPGSWYAAQDAVVEDRAQASQRTAISAESFSSRLADVLLAAKPPAVVRLGPKSRMLPVLKALLPTASLDRILMKRFALR